MNREFWIDRWNENRIGFHRQDVNPLLESFWPQVAAERGERVLAPLCGKSEDLRWLADRGQSVVGVEFSELAARAFAEEQGIHFTEARIGSFLVFKSDRIQLYVGDFFDFSIATAGTFPLFYDRAALIALPPATRPRYAANLVSLLEDGARGLLIALEYDTAQMDGPPFSVPEDEVRRLFSGFRIERVLANDCLDEEPRFKERGVQWMREVVYSLRK